MRWIMALNLKRKSLVDVDQAKADKALAKGNAPREVDVNLADKVSLDILKEPEVELLSVEGLKKIYPRKANDETLAECVSIMNESIKGMDSIMREHYRDNLVNVIDVIKEERMLSSWIMLKLLSSVALRWQDILILELIV